MGCLWGAGFVGRPILVSRTVHFLLLLLRMLEEVLHLVPGNIPIQIWVFHVEFSDAHFQANQNRHGQVGTILGEVGEVLEEPRCLSWKAL